ncbi:DUF6544 family protein [Mucilaginibacter antarcticus]|uniref:DUF6544 family protein n=1 Tax=Mucilaginibacter antarcticus TaxID=1855725 RepID=A0ABW5XT46_9SPHI
MVISLSIFAVLVLFYLARKVYLSRQYGDEVISLFANSKTIAEQLFDYAQLSGMPEPVQRYFKYALKQGQSYISYARIKHDGQFKTGADKDWVNIQGEQYATTQKPGFIWKGTTTMFTARDIYILDKGRLVVELFGLIKIAGGKGKAYDQGELLRWLGESVLYPTNLLPGRNLQWSAIDAHTARLTFSYNDLTLSYRVTFNDAGEIVEMETKRYMDSSHLETWIIKMANYREMNDVMVPTSFEVIWRLKEGDLCYAKFNVNEIEYNKPERF